MKTTLTIVLLTFSCSLFSMSKPSHPPGNPGDTLDLIIGAGTNDKAVIDNIRSKISQASNIVIVGYCKNFNVFLLRAFKPDYASVDMVFQTVQKYLPSQELFRKEGTLKGLVSECIFSSEDDPAKAKDVMSSH